MSRADTRLRTFYKWIQAVGEVVGQLELAQDKLTPLLRLRYHDSIADAVAHLGRPEAFGLLFSGFQRYLYTRTHGVTP